MTLKYLGVLYRVATILAQSVTVERYFFEVHVGLFVFHTYFSSPMKPKSMCSCMWQ